MAKDKKRVIDISGLDPETKKKVRTIVELGKNFGGDEKVGGYLMEQLFGALMPTEDPKTNKLDEMASLLDLSGGDPNIQKLFNKEAYGYLGIDPEAEAEKDALLKQFQGEFPTEGENAGINAKNAPIISQVQQNPQLGQEFLATEPAGPDYLRNPLNPFTAVGDFQKFMEAYKAQQPDAKRERFNNLASKYQVPTN